MELKSPLRSLAAAKGRGIEMGEVKGRKGEGKEEREGDSGVTREGADRLA